MSGGFWGEDGWVRPIEGTGRPLEEEEVVQLVGGMGRLVEVAGGLMC